MTGAARWVRTNLVEGEKGSVAGACPVATAAVDVRVCLL